MPLTNLDDDINNMNIELYYSVNIGLIHFVMFDSHQYLNNHEARIKILGWL